MSGFRTRPGSGDGVLWLRCAVMAATKTTQLLCVVNLLALWIIRLSLVAMRCEFSWEIAMPMRCVCAFVYMHWGTPKEWYDGASIKRCIRLYVNGALAALCSTDRRRKPTHMLALASPRWCDRAGAKRAKRNDLLQGQRAGGWCIVVVCFASFGTSGVI